MFQIASLKIIFIDSTEILFSKLWSASSIYHFPNKDIEHMHEGVWLKNVFFLTQWQLLKLSKFFPNQAFVYA